jgi:hypothetical protein
MDKQQRPKFSPEVRKRAVRMVIEHRGESQAMVPQILVAILCVMSPVSRLPMPDIAFRSACFDTSTACFAE